MAEKRDGEDGGRPRFDPTINLGHIITLTGVIMSMIAGWYSVDARLSGAERQLTRLIVVVETSIRQEEQIKGLQATVARLEGQVLTLRDALANGRAKQ